MTSLPGSRRAEWSFLGEAASGLGFAALGVAAAGPVPEEARRFFEDWLAAGRHGGMGYLERHRAQRIDPRHERMVPDASAVICAALPYASGAARGGFWDHVAAHARGRDYHATMRERLGSLARAIEDRYPECRWRVFVDTAPILERSWAVAAGLGTIGRHGGLIVPEVGARVVLGEIVCAGTPSPEGSPAAPRFEQCADCDRCVAACPTGAIGARGEIDARRCLSYQTIEHRGSEPPPEVGRTARLVFGCDECTAACPLESPSAETGLEEPQTLGPTTMTLERLVDAAPGEIEAILAGTCIERSGASIIERNARAIALRRGRSAPTITGTKEP